jgi:hypothetical protein
VAPNRARPGRLLVLLTSLWLVLPAAAPGRTQSVSTPPPTPGAAGAVPAPATQAPDSGVISRGSPVQGGPAPDIVIFYAGEVMGWTEPCG